MRMVLPMLAEMWPVRPYPLDMTTFTGVLERAVGNFLAVMIGKSAPDPDKALVEEDGVVVRFEPPQIHPSPGMLITPWLTFWRTRHDDPAKWELDPLLAEVIQQGRELNGRNPSLLTWEQNIEMLHESLALIPRVMQLRERYFPQAILGLGQLWLLLALTGHGDQFGELLGGVETKTTETNRALQSLAAQIRSDPILRDLFANSQIEELQSKLAESETGRDFSKHFAAFLSEYGHRETALTISEGAWKDQPQLVLGILKVQAATTHQEPDSYQTWKHTRDELLAHSMLGGWPLRNWFLKALSNGRALFQMREDTHFYATLVQPPVRHVALELGKRLKEIGVLNSAEDVLHLKLDELEGLGQPWPPTDETRGHIRELVNLRRAKRESLAGTPMVDPRLLAVESQAYPGEDVLLSGSPGSPGVASGPARIVHDGSEFGKLQPGDVLVAPVTNPAWTPLFQHAAAVVVDTGGAASHAAIVAREYGVPAVMGTLNGTQQLKDGQWIRVDGSRGLVLKAEETK
jgi:pyruvate,water dikinase